MMETDNEQTSSAQTGTEDTIGSSDLNADEAEAITRSMDMSIAFWGTSKEPPEKIPATRLKCPLKRPGKASNIALKIWEKMTQRDLNKVREIEVSLMTEGEIGTLELINALKYIIEDIGMEFEEMLKSVDEDPIESTITLTNEILHIFNLNEPPEIVGDEEYNTYIQYSPVSNACKKSERQQKDITNKMKVLLNRAEHMGIHDIRIPSSPYLTERSKLSLIEKQISSKIKLRNMQRIFEEREKGLFNSGFGECKYEQAMRYQNKRPSQQRKEPKRSTLADRPRFRPAVKAESSRYDDMVKHAPDINKRIKRIREIRKKFLEKSKNNSEINSTNFLEVRNARTRQHSSPYNYSNFSLSYKGRTPKIHKRYQYSQMNSSNLRDYNMYGSNSNRRFNIESDETLENVVNYNNDRSSCSLQDQSACGREEMLCEMKKIVNEAVGVVKEPDYVKRPVYSLDKRKSFKLRARDKHRYNKTKASDAKNYVLKRKDENSYPLDVKNHDGTVVTVKQESGNPNANLEEKVSTEVKVCRSFGGPGLKVSVISTVSGIEEVDNALRPKSSRKDIREAISVLKEYIALKSNKSLVNMGSSEKEENGSLMLTDLTSTDRDHSLVASETVRTTEVIVEPGVENSTEVEKMNEIIEEDTDPKQYEYSTWNAGEDMNDEGDNETFQTYAVTMLMPMASTGQGVGFMNPFSYGGLYLNRNSEMPVSEQIGDVGDNGWSTWDGSVWHRVHLDDSCTANIRNESDSLYVNTSEEQVSCNSLPEDISVVRQQSIEATVSTLSVIVVEGEDRSNRTSMITSAATGVYRFFINSILGVLTLLYKPLSIVTAFKSRRNENSQ